MKKLITRTSLISLLIFLVTGCAKNPDNISASYVSPLIYNDFSCRQLQGELGRITRKVNEITGRQRSLATKDGVALGVGLVIFWPALFFMIGDNKKDELAHLKGEYDALEQAAIQKDCKYVPELQEARLKQQEQEEKRRKEQQRSNNNMN